MERGPIWPTTKSCQLLGTPCNIKPPTHPPKKDSPQKTLFFFQKFLWDIPSHIIQPWHHLPQNFFRWTAHEIWLKTKINLQFQLYCSWGTHLFRLRKFIQKQEIWASRPPILNPVRFINSGFFKLKIILFGYQCTHLCFQRWGIKTSWLQSQKMKGNTYFEPISASSWHF